MPRVLFCLKKSSVTTCHPFPADPSPIDRVSSTGDGTASLEPGHGKKGDSMVVASRQLFIL